MKDIKKSASFKSKVKGKETPFNVDLNYSAENDSFNIKVKKGEGFLSYTDSLQNLPFEVVKKLNNLLEEVLAQADSKYHTKKFDYDYADIGQFSLPDSQRNKTEQEYINLGKNIVKTKFDGDLTKAYDYVVRKKREFGGDFQAGVYDEGGKIDLTDDNKLRLRKPAMPEKKLSEREWIAKHNESKEARTYGFGGLFGKAMQKPKPLNLDEKQVRLKTGEYVQVLDHAGDTLMVMDLNKLGSGAVAKRVELSDVDMDSFKYGGALIGNQKRIDMNKNGKIDAEDFKILRKSMNGAWRNERKHVNHNEDYEVRYARKKPSRTGYKGKRKFSVGGGVEGKDTWQNLLENFGFKKGRSKYGVDVYSKRGYVATIDSKQRIVELMFDNDVLYKGYSIQGLLDVLQDQFGKRKFGEGGGISNFERLSRVVAKNYVGKQVKPKYQKEYGKVYSKSEAKEVGDKVAGKMKLMKK